MRIGILLFDRVDLLDAGGPYEVFLTASRLAARGGAEPPFEVLTVGAGDGPVTAYGGMGLVPHVAARDAGPLDVLVVPGAIDIEAVAADRAVRDALAVVAPAGTVTASVCTGAFLLADAGLLGGRPWTTHWEDVAALEARTGTAGATERWVDAGEVVTSGGLSAGIAMSLHLVDRLAGRDLAVATARQLDYAWDPGDGAGR